MVLTTNSGPQLTFGITRDSAGNVTQYNEERGTSLFDLGIGLTDPRAVFAYKPGSAVGTPVYGFFNTEALVDYTPSAASTNALISNTQPTAGSAVTLTATGASIIATTIVAPESGTTVSVFAIDSTAASLPMGQAGTITLWNPAGGTGRNITINFSSNLDGGSFTVAGRDAYGIKMTEQIATAASTSIAGKKAFKYITSVAASSTITSTGITVGYGNIFGWPLTLSYAGLNATAAQSSNALTTTTIALSSVSITLASTLTMTSTTPDVRGTFTSTATNGTTRLQLYQNMTANQMATITSTNHTSLFGFPQFSSV